MVKSVPPKSCELDPIPTKILKDHIDALAYGIANIINTSLEYGYVCDSHKEAILRPLLKLPMLDLVFPNFRPVSKPSIFRQTSPMVCEPTTYEIC